VPTDLDPSLSGVHSKIKRRAATVLAASNHHFNNEWSVMMSDFFRAIQHFHN
jgi:hypothetical protein